MFAGGFYHKSAFDVKILCYNKESNGVRGKKVDYWMIAVAALTAILLALVILCFRMRRKYRAEKTQLEQENGRLRDENISMRRELAALERDLEAEQAHSDDLALEIEELRTQLEQASERVRRAEDRRTDAEKEMFATRMRVDQLQQQLRQSRDEQNNQERLYQDIISDRDQTIASLQDKLYKRRRKKKEDVLDQQITLDDILNGNNI